MNIYFITATAGEKMISAVVEAEDSESAEELLSEQLRTGKYVYDPILMGRSVQNRFEECVWIIDRGEV